MLGELAAQQISEPFTPFRRRVQVRARGARPVLEALTAVQWHINADENVTVLVRFGTDYFLSCAVLRITRNVIWYTIISYVLENV